jgi:hypothetical protein
MKEYAIKTAAAARIEPELPPLSYISGNLSGT